MDNLRRDHWNTCYASTPVPQLVWYEATPAPSLRLLDRCGIAPDDPTWMQALARAPIKSALPGLTPSVTLGLTSYLISARENVTVEAIIDFAVRFDFNHRCWDRIMAAID
jgi:hypothetical protein